MRTTDVNVICQSTESATEEICLHLRTRPTGAAAMNGFWYLQDLLGQLVEAAHDRQSETLFILEAQHAGLVLRILDVLQAAGELQYIRNRAIQASCEVINRSLESLERIKQSQSLAAIA